MSQVRLKQCLAEELPAINAALEAAIAELPQPCQPVARHVIGAGGKRLRPFLALLMARLAGASGPAIYRLGATMELLHGATLLHDDILDQAQLRRGQPAAHVLYGTAATILAGDAMLALGNSIVAEFNQPSLSKAYSIATMETAAGEILEMNSLRNPETTEEEYIAIIRGKTACLIAQSCALGALFGSGDAQLAHNAASFGENLGIAFQLVDDALDFAPASQTGKPAGGDLREGKLTIPLRLYRASLDPTSRFEFDKMFRKENICESKQAEICAAVRPYLEKSLVMADGYLEKALEFLHHLPRCGELEILQAMPAYIRKRSK